MTRAALLLVLIGCHSSSSTAVDATPSPLCTVGSACSTGSFCEAFTAGLAPMAGTCTMLPAACATTPTCACLMTNLVGCGGLLCSGSGADLGVVCEGI